MSDSNTAEIPDFATLAADPEIAALLDFEPVPRKIEREGGWTGEAQREFVARLAFRGSVSRACKDMEKDRGGVRKLYGTPESESFDAARAAAIALFQRRRKERAGEESGGGRGEATGAR